MDAVGSYCRQSGDDVGVLLIREGDDVQGRRQIRQAGGQRDLERHSPSLFTADHAGEQYRNVGGIIQPPARQRGKGTAEVSIRHLHDSLWRLPVVHDSSPAVRYKSA